MVIARFFLEHVTLGRHALPPVEAHHAGSVLRVKIAEPVEVFDGRGTVGHGAICTVSRHRIEIEVARVEERPFDLRHRIVLAVSLGKAHRQSYLVEKCTELGVAGIWAIRTERSVAKPDEWSIVKWSKRAIEACKQSKRVWVPAVEGPFRIEEALIRRNEFEVMALADPGAQSIPFDQLLRTTTEGSSVLVWIGPEGGWGEVERRMFLKHGALAVQLAPTILRTETAAVAACAAAAMTSLNHAASPLVNRDVCGGASAPPPS